MNEVHIAKAYINKASNAKERGILFELSFAEFKKIYLSKYCAYTGEKFEPKSQQNTTCNPMQMTIERVDNSIGYVHNNCVAVAYWVNTWLGDKDKRVLINIAENLKRHETKSIKRATPIQHSKQRANINSRAARFG